MSDLTMPTTLSEMSEEQRAAVRQMMDQVLLCLIVKAGGKLVLTVDEVDLLPVDKVLTIEINDKERQFIFNAKNTN